MSVVKKYVMSCLLVLSCCCLFSSPRVTEAQAPSCGQSGFDGAFMFLAFECLNDVIVVCPDSTRADGYGWQYIQDNPYNAIDNDGTFNGSLVGPNSTINDDFELYGVAFRETATEVYIVITSEISRYGTTLSDAHDGHVGYGDILISFNYQANLNRFGYQSNNYQLWGIHFSGANTDSAVTMDGVYNNVRAKTVSDLNDGYSDLQTYLNVVEDLGGTIGMGDINPARYDDNNNGDYGDDYMENDFYSRSISLNVISSGINRGNIQSLNWTQLVNAGFDPNFLKKGTFVAFKFQKGLMVDQCGVVGGDNSTCPRDCQGTICGNANYDLCGVCGGNNSTCKDCDGIPNGSNYSCVDCAGIPHGTSQVDQCGVCGGTNDCLDCAGVPHGGKTVDQCGVCGGDNSSCSDCSGTPYGTKVLDKCGVCGGDGSSCSDCTGTPNGAAVLDECGVCGGDGSTCKDCTNTPFGQKKVDRCGVCGGDGTSCLDCAGIPNGNTKVDACGTCGGSGPDAIGCCPGDSKNSQGVSCCNDGSAKDVCGICGGDGKSCLDCSGTPFGSKTVDSCGVCGGDGTSCITCDSVDVLETQYILDGTGLEQRLLLRKILDKLSRKAKKRKKLNTFIQNSHLEGDRLYLRNWEFTWTLPSVIKNCDAGTNCVTASTTSQTDGYENNSIAFFNLQKKAVRKLRRLTKHNRVGKRFVKRGRKLVSKTKSLLNTIPKTQDICS